MLPPVYVKTFSSYKSTGNLFQIYHSWCEVSHTKFSGSSLRIRNQRWFSFAGGSWYFSWKTKPDGTYINHGQNGKDELVIPALSALLGGHPIKADLQVSDLRNPYLSLNRFQLTLICHQLQHFIKRIRSNHCQVKWIWKLLFASKSKISLPWTAGRHTKWKLPVLLTWKCRFPSSSEIPDL